jgi:hypothetical protein
LISDALEFSESFGARHGASQMTAWMGEGHPYHEAFGQFGLTPVASGRYVFVFPGVQPYGDLRRSDFWHFSQGDSDVY